MRTNIIITRSATRLPVQMNYVLCRNFFTRIKNHGPYQFTLTIKLALVLSSIAYTFMNTHTNTYK